MTHEIVRHTDVDSKIAAHRADASAHHVKTGHHEVYGLVETGLAVNRPAAGVAGRWFISTDTLEISYDNGVAWRRVGVLRGKDVSALDAGDIVTGRFPLARIPDGPSGQVLTARGAGLSPIYTGVRGEVRTTDPVPLEEGMFWYRSDLGRWRVAEGVAFGENLRSAASPTLTSSGIGGDNTTIWYCDWAAALRELSATDFTVVRSAASPAANPSGVGGNSTTIWHCDTNVDLIYELSTVDFTVVRSAAAPATSPWGIGGDSTTIWHCDSGVDRIYELSITNFAVVRSAVSPGTGPFGVGGDSSTIWHCDGNADRIYELSTTDFAVVRSAVSPGTSPSGVGGNSTTIWHCDSGVDLVYELGADFIARTITTS